MRDSYCHLHSHYGVENHGLVNLNDIYWNLPSTKLYEQVIRHAEGVIGHRGSLITNTGRHMGRAAGDKFIVDDKETHDLVDWGKINHPISEDKFNQIHQKMCSHLEMHDIYVQDCYAGKHKQHRMPIRIITQYAWHSLFARNMFVLATDAELTSHLPEFTVLNAPTFHAKPSEDGTVSDTFIIINFSQRLILIGGTAYAGEIKKSIFTAMNYLLPKKSILPMHCAANIGDEGTALFFGLSGTGKTTLSADSSRTLIGDDEHGWCDDGVFNFEGGCYAKLIHLKKEYEPEVFATTRMFGTILENVDADARTRHVNFDSAKFTENTRGSYPIDYIPNASTTGMGGQPKNVLFLCADAFGVIPPVAKLTVQQAIYYFLSGYTAKVAGTEDGVIKPIPNFSACYGAPFMPLKPQRYAKILVDKLQRYNVNVWLINTGWIGGPYGIGSRISIPYTRAMVRAVLNGSLANVEMVVEPFFHLSVPKSCPNVPSDILLPRETWQDKQAYDMQAEQLVKMFDSNYQQYQ